MDKRTVHGGQVRAKIPGTVPGSPAGKGCGQGLDSGKLLKRNQPRSEYAGRRRRIGALFRKRCLGSDAFRMCRARGDYPEPELLQPDHTPGSQQGAPSEGLEQHAWPGLHLTEWVRRGRCGQCVWPDSGRQCRVAGWEYQFLFRRWNDGSDRSGYDRPSGLHGDAGLQSSLSGRTYHRVHAGPGYPEYLRWRGQQSGELPDRSEGILLLPRIDPVPGRHHLKLQPADDAFLLSEVKQELQHQLCQRGWRPRSDRAV